MTTTDNKQQQIPKAVAQPGKKGFQKSGNYLNIKWYVENDQKKLVEIYNLYNFSDVSITEIAQVYNLQPTWFGTQARRLGWKKPTQTELNQNILQNILKKEEDKKEDSLNSGMANVQAKRQNITIPIVVADAGVEKKYKIQPNNQNGSDINSNKDTESSKTSKSKGGRPRGSKNKPRQQPDHPLESPDDIAPIDLDKWKQQLKERRQDNKQRAERRSAKIN